jgi:hypothetical protein
MVGMNMYVVLVLRRDKMSAKYAIIIIIVSINVLQIGHQGALLRLRIWLGANNPSG